MEHPSPSCSQRSSTGPVPENGLLTNRSGNTYDGPLVSIILLTPVSWLENEGRRKLLWIVYILERYAALVTNSDYIIREEEIERLVSCRYD